MVALFSIGIGWLLGDGVFCTICALADRFGHHRDYLGVGPEVLLAITLMASGGFVGWALSR